MKRHPPQLLTLCLATLSTALAVLGACTPADQVPLSVAAAASLTGAFEELAQGYQSAGGGPVRLSFASTGALAEQLRNGGPFDVFAAADAQHVDDLIGEGILTRPSRVLFAEGRLVLLFSPTFDGDPADITVLLGPGVKRIAIANPEYAPYGVAARQFLQSAGLWEAVQSRLVMGETVRQAAVFVQTGNADAGLVALSVVAPGDRFVMLPTNGYAPIQHVAAIRAESPHAEQAQRFLDYLLSSDAGRILEKYGLQPMLEPAQ